MKNYFNSINKYLIAYIALYLIMCFVSLFFIRCEFDIEYDGFIETEILTNNIKVLRYYFITLPIASAIPLVLYYLFSRNAHGKEQQSDNCIIPSSIDIIQNDNFFYAMRRLAYNEYWIKISANPAKAIRYMLHYPDLFFIATDPQEKPQWEDSSFCEIMLINGKRYYIYLHTKTFMIDLAKCVNIVEIQKTIAQ